MAHRKRTFLTWIDVLVSAGAAVIIFAAWAKLTHQAFADILLTVGMWTETGIFMVYAYIEWLMPKKHEEAEEEETSIGALDTMMRDAEITPAHIKRLGEGFQKLGTTVSNMSEIGDMVKATGDFSNKTKEASAAMVSMTTSFTNSAQTMSSFNSAASSAKTFHEQVQVLTKNLGSLNTIYELELKESNNHLKALNSFYGKLAEASASMMASVDDANKAKDQISTLANNLGKLNAVYGNMLSAMQGR